MIIELWIDARSDYLIVVNLGCTAACDHDYFAPHEMFKELNRVVEARHLGVARHDVYEKAVVHHLLPKSI
jgi:hypothetical protein